jgi:MipA family protein
MKTFAVLGSLAIGANALAQPVAAKPEEVDDLRFVAGLAVVNGPVYWGQAERKSVAHPFFALRWGKLRISNSRAGSLLGEGSAGGASTDVIDRGDWRLRLGLRIDRGLKIDGSSDRLQDLLPVRGTLRGRVMLSHRLGPQSSWNVSVAPDLLGRKGGTVVQWGYGRSLDDLDLPSGGGRWSLSAGLGAGDARYMQSYFGVPQGAVRFAPYQPGAGLRNATAGLGWQRLFGDRQQWVLFSGANLQRLLGPAAKAPFVEHATTWSADLGLAYRY